MHVLSMFPYEPSDSRIFSQPFWFSLPIKVGQRWTLYWEVVNKNIGNMGNFIT
jgi:hypothetical protein